VRDNATFDQELTIVDQDENPRTGSTISGNEQGVYCANDAPNVFNEASCVLSRADAACVREGADDEDTVVATRLAAGTPTSSLARIGVHVGDRAEGVPLEVAGLGYDAGTWPAPCGRSVVSRFARDGDPTNQAACTNLGPAPVDATTQETFHYLLSHSVSNNEDVRDIVMVRVWSVLERHCLPSSMRVRPLFSRLAFPICYLVPSKDRPGMPPFRFSQDGLLRHGFLDR
jgi:hypothetical protein